MELDRGCALPCPTRGADSCAIVVNLSRVHVRLGRSSAHLGPHAAVPQASAQASRASHMCGRVGKASLGCACVSRCLVLGHSAQVEPPRAARLPGGTTTAHVRCEGDALSSIAPWPRGMLLPALPLRKPAGDQWGPSRRCRRAATRRSPSPAGLILRLKRDRAGFSQERPRWFLARAPPLSRRLWGAPPPPPAPDRPPTETVQSWHSSAPPHRCLDRLPPPRAKRLHLGGAWSPGPSLDMIGASGDIGRAVVLEVGREGAKVGGLSSDVEAGKPRRMGESSRATTSPSLDHTCPPE